ncbi:MAG: hypothetical protein KatS3mg014_2399 [Actinomycetota bacterium]|nr:MAG: hypothetical protein KatS3mg014_2399 [Actinomycetota bacterium]
MLHVAMVRVTVRVVPRSARTAVEAAPEGVRVRVRSAPERGRATEEARRALAEALGVAPSAVRVVAGATSRTETFEVEGLEAADLRRRLSGA